MTARDSYLRRVGLFQDLSPEELHSISHGTRLVHYSAGHLFYMPEDAAEVLFILKQGRVQLYQVSPDGRKLVVAILHPGAIFGHMALVGQNMHYNYAQALDQVVICVWNREEVEALLLRQPRVALRFLDAVGERLWYAEQRLAEVAFMRVPPRLALLLLRLSDQHGSPVLQGYTHQALADMLGVYRETVSQILKAFKADRLIHLGRRRLEVLDRAGLEQVAGSHEAGRGAAPAALSD
ncbi:MAG: Crp/Fnr family transcriptional regulator [Anaerolineae bacterium]|nr:Crp/Fnr family transcriptional regulator [Anaerolineae bacterium]